MRKLKAPAMVIVLFLATQLAAMAQMKIGYTSVDIILQQMPETTVMAKQLAAYQNSLQQGLVAPANLLRDKTNQYTKEAQTGTVPAVTAQARIQELERLEVDLQKKREEAQRNLQLREQSLLSPILGKVQKAINEIAAEDGYTYILNQSNQGDYPMILFGEPKHDVTTKVLKKLGIEVKDLGNQ